MANKIVIDFQLGKGSTKVKQAIESLATAQSKLNNTVKAAKPPQKSLDAALNKVALSLIKATHNSN